MRQPLSEIIIHGVSQHLTDEMRELVLDELNIKNLKYVTNDEELFSYNAKADFKILGPKLGKRIKEVSATIADISDGEIRRIIDSGKVSVNGEDIQLDDLIISRIPREGYSVNSNNGLTIALNHSISSDLYSEWLARELVHNIQNQRKKAELEVTQRIGIKCGATTELSKAVKKHEAYIKSETLALSVEINDFDTTGNLSTVGDQSCRIEIKTVN
ncbi:MAG: hypothetical protein HQ568_00600 [Calditrichaeota bacterium]|nr:hypothetical protein [Calditrichota bacterium]